MTVEPGRTYRYQLSVRTAAGETRSSPVTLTVPVTPATVGPNFPNPFTAATSIRFSLGRRSSATVTVFDASGRMVARFDEGTLDPGEHAVDWDGRDERGRPVTSGVYFYRLEGGGDAAWGKMQVVR